MDNQIEFLGLTKGNKMINESHYLIDDLVHQIRCLRNRLRVVDKDMRTATKADMLILAFSIGRAKAIRRAFESLGREKEV